MRFPGLAAALTAVLAAAVALAAAAPAPDGKALWAERCAGCHENATGRTPTRAVLESNPPGFIVSALTTGIMVPMAEGLTGADKDAIARYISKVKETPASFHEIDSRQIWGDGVDGKPLDAPKCTVAGPRVDPAATGNWQGWGNGPANARFQPTPGLNAIDVPRLKLKWAFRQAGAKNGQATVIGGRVFVTAMSGAVYALDAATGCVHWRYAAPAATRSSVTVIALPGGRHALFIADWTKEAVALDADSGAVIWKTTIDDQPAEQMTGAPTVWDGKLYVPIASGTEAFAINDKWECCKFRGAVVALDVATGKVLWKRYMLPDVPRIFKTNAAGKPMWGPSGAAIWGAPTVDTKRRLLYAGTSNSYTDLDFPTADSVVALDADTGAIRWVNQLRPKDTYIDGCWNKAAPKQPDNCPVQLGPDFEIGASPIVVGNRILIGQKSGEVYALDADHAGRKLWEQRLSPGSALGGVEFGMAVEGDRLLVGISDVVGGAGAKPGLHALDLATGKVLWSDFAPVHPTCRWTSFWCHGAISQAVTAIPGVVFAGSYDGHFRAADTATGRIVWDVDTGSTPIKTLDGGEAYGGTMDGAGPTVANGMVFVHSGYAGRSGAFAGKNMRAAEGNVLMAFSVDGK